jgi:hypothetical protein
MYGHTHACAKQRASHILTHTHTHRSHGAQSALILDISQVVAGNTARANVCKIALGIENQIAADTEPQGSLSSSAKKKMFDKNQKNWIIMKAYKFIQKTGECLAFSSKSVDVNMLRYFESMFACAGMHAYMHRRASRF